MNEKKISKKTVIIIIVAALLVIALTVGIILAVSLLGREPTYRFDYLGEDLTPYVQISESDYKGYTLTVKMSPVTEKTVEEWIMQLLYEHRSDEAENPGKTAPITAGDTVEIWYRGYLKDESGRETEIDGLSNMDSSTPYKLGIGSASLPLGVESSLVGVVIADYASLEDAKRAAGDTVSAEDILYLSYTLLSPKDGETYHSAVRVDLSRDDLDSVFGVGFKDIFIGNHVPESGEKLASFTTTTEAGRLVYSNVRIDVAYPKNSDLLTVEARLPYDYEDFELSGSKIYFDIFPHYFTAYAVPELDESFITETLKLTTDSLAEYEGDTLIDRYKASVKAELVASSEEELRSIKTDAMWYHYKDKAVISEYPEDAVMAIYSADVKEIKTVWAQYKSEYPDFDDFARLYLELTEDSDWKAKLMDDAKLEVREKLIFYYIIKKEEILPTESEYKPLYDKLFDEYVVFYMEDKTEEDFDSPEAYAEARAKAETEVLDYYGEDFFRDQVYYDFAINALLDFAKLEIIN